MELRLRMRLHPLLRTLGRGGARVARTQRRRPVGGNLRTGGKTILIDTCVGNHKDRADWPAFIAEADRVYGEMWRDFDAFCRDRGAPPLGRGPSGYEFIHESPWINLYSYPAEADYRRERPLGPT